MDGRILHANRAARQLLGLGAGGHSQLRLRDLILPSDREEALRQAQQMAGRAVGGAAAPPAAGRRGDAERAPRNRCDHRPARPGALPVPPVPGLRQGPAPPRGAAGGQAQRRAGQRSQDDLSLPHEP
jgi:PAS domain-containing protein